MPLIPGQKKIIELFVKKSSIQLNDNIIPFLNPEEEFFLSVDNMKSFDTDPNRFGFSIMEVTIRTDFAFDTYTRQVYDLS